MLTDWHQNVADGIARSAVRDLASPAECEARENRMRAARMAAIARIEGLRNAMDQIRRFGIRSPQEFKAILECANGAIGPHSVIDSLLKDASERLLEITTDLDGALFGMEAELRAELRS